MQEGAIANGGAATTALVESVERARRIVFFTGAGISTDSGIDDFRSPGGVWSRMRPIQFADFLADEDVRREDWRRRFRFRREFEAARPNLAHEVIAAFVREGRALGVVTQNIDNLHQRAGVPPSKMIELHGNGTRAACLDCGRPHDLDDLQVAFERSDAPPVCGACGGHVKATVISFGQPMPVEEVRRAQTLCEACDLLIVVGSSLVVQPAATLPLLAKRAGAMLAIVNRDPTPLDMAADILVNGEIAETFAALGDECCICESGSGNRLAKHPLTMCQALFVLRPPGQGELESRLTSPATGPVRLQGVWCDGGRVFAGYGW